MKQHTQLPRVKPVQPVSVKAPADLPTGKPGWSYELKYDGYRGLLHMDGETCWFAGKRGQRLEKKFDEFCRALAGILRARKGAITSAILDGEIVTMNSGGAFARHRVRSRGATLHYFAFDLLWLNGEDLRLFPLEERRRRLHAIMPKRSNILLPVLAVAGKDREKFFAMVHKNNLEGVVAKRLAAPYTGSTRWVKIKNKEYRARSPQAGASRDASKRKSARR